VPSHCVPWDVLPYSATKRITIFRTARVRTAPEGRVGTAVRSRRVSSTHAFVGRLSSRSEISSIGDWLGCGMEARLVFLVEAMIYQSSPFSSLGLLRDLHGRLGSLTLFPACGRFALFRGHGRLQSGFRLVWGGGFHYPPPSHHMRPFRA
jgi:hypothetical protein